MLRQAGGHRVHRRQAAPRVLNHKPVCEPFSSRVRTLANLPFRFHPGRTNELYWAYINDEVTYPMKTFEGIVAGYYNALTAGLGLSGSDVQLVQPTVVPSDNTSLWAFLDQLPPTSLYRNSGESAEGSFFGTYEEILASLQIPSKNRFLKTVGQKIADEFIQFLSTRFGEPSPTNMYPAIFRRWALLHHPAVANQGTTALTGMLLEPLGAASVTLLGYQDQTTQPPQPGCSPDWDESYDELVTSLKTSPSREFSVTADTIVSDVTNTWTHGNIGNYAGLWGSSSPASKQARSFATSEFQLDVSIGHVLLFRPIPGPWYSSAALNIAYSNSEIPPWVSNPLLDWDKAFGINGILRNIANSLIIVDSFQATIESIGPYSQDDQQIILNNQSSGLWPLYMTTNAKTTCSFTRDGALEISIDTEPGVPVLIGIVTTSIQRYLGHNT